MILYENDKTDDSKVYCRLYKPYIDNVILCILVEYKNKIQL